MVDPLRISSIPCSSPDYSAGLYVVGKSNATNQTIPHLPSIQVLESDEGFSVEIIESPGMDAIQEDIKCLNLHESFCDGDIVWIDTKRGEVRSILSEKSNSNTLLLTEQCENRCLFCSQPPNNLEDTELYIKATLALLNFSSTGYVGLSGGEPTHNTRAFIKLLENLQHFKVQTKLHILTMVGSFLTSNLLKRLMIIFLAERFCGVSQYMGTILCFTTILLIPMVPLVRLLKGCQTF